MFRMELGSNTFSGEYTRETRLYFNILFMLITNTPESPLLFLFWMIHKVILRVSIEIPHTQRKPVVSYIMH